MRFSPQLLDEIRARLPVSQVVARHVRLKRAGREFIGLSPFKHEKTPSFTVNDRKGFFHCFSTGEHGDIFAFLMKVEGIGFSEAVEKCAAEAGVALPKPSETEQRAEDGLRRLREVAEASCRFFQSALMGPEGKTARAYLQKRGLDAGAIGRFRLGYAPDGRDILKRHLLSLGFSIGEIVASGMCIGGEDIAVPYDRFRDRVMFPIEDFKGAVIAFGGRALSAVQKAKYLNSPETPLFHKGHLLYNMAKARPAAFERESIVVVEGYMDVIACAEAGFGYTVAPLGTALTEEQIRLLWRMAKEPILCFDGDAAGRKAAERAINIVLPLLGPGRSLRFAFLPDGPDPDDLIRNEGAAAFAQVLAAARPLVDVLWGRELAQSPTDTPERRAAFESRLHAETAKIADAAVRGYYERELRARLWQMWKGAGRASAAGSRDRSTQWRVGGSFRFPAGGARRDGFPRLPSPPISEALRHSAVVRSAKGGASPTEALMLRAVLTHPWLLEDHSEEIAELSFTQRAFVELRDAILRAQVSRVSENGLDSGELRVHLMEEGFGEVLGSLDPVRFDSQRWARSSDFDRETVEDNWRHTVGLYRSERMMMAELKGAERDFYQEISEENAVRIRDLNVHYHLSEFKAAGSAGNSDTNSLDDFLAATLKQHANKR